MSTKNTDLTSNNKVFGYIALVTAAILSIPFTLMKFNLVKPDPSNPHDEGVNWTPSDFIVMGVLIFGISSLFVIIARITPRKYRAIIGIGLLFTFLWIWAELAVGVFTNWGS